MAGGAADVSGELADAQPALTAQVAQSLAERRRRSLPHGGILEVLDASRRLGNSLVLSFFRLVAYDIGRGDERRRSGRYG